MRGSKWLAVAVAVGSITTGVAVAGGGSSKTMPVNGDFTAKVDGTPKVKRCDSKHVRVRVKYVGTQTSSDARLAGDLEIRAETVVKAKKGSTEYGWGYTKGTFTVRKTYSPKHTLRGKFVGVVEPDGGVEGFLTGKTQGHRRSVHLLANFNADEHPDGSITGEFGKDSQVQKPYAPDEHEDPAVVTGGCKKGHH